MKRVNERRWALVDETGETIELCESGLSKKAVKAIWFNYPECRIACVQITEIKEASDGKG